MPQRARDALYCRRCAEWRPSTEFRTAIHRIEWWDEERGSWRTFVARQHRECRELQLLLRTVTREQRAV